MTRSAEIDRRGIDASRAGAPAGSRPVVLRPLSGTADEGAALQRVLDGAPAYAALVTGGPVGPEDASSVFAALPPGRTYDDKFVYGVFADGVMVGCVDVIRGFPIDGTAHIGLLLVDERHRRRGFGRAAFEATRDVACAWGCSTLRIAVLRENVAADRFWRAMGFAPTGEVRPYRHGSVESETVIQALALSARTMPAQGPRSGGSAGRVR